MAFRSIQTKTYYEIDGKRITDINVVFKHMEDNNLTTLGGLKLVAKTIDAAIYETPDDDEIVGIPSLATYNTLNPTDLAFDSSTFGSSSGIVAGDTKESAYIGPAEP